MPPSITSAVPTTSPVGYNRVAAGEGHAGLSWGGRGNHERVLRSAYAPRGVRRTLGGLIS